MATCFVIQPFDGGAFDKRYDDVIKPAIVEAGLEPYRVDRDPGSSILIDSIEQGIKAAALCVAEITTENPNVWYELGFAFAAGKEVVLLCSKERTKFPFDVQHRNILVYSTESLSDFEKARKQLVERVRAALSKARDLATLASPVRAAESGMPPHEVALLALLMENTLERPLVSIRPLREDMERAGFNATAVGVAARALVRKGLISQENDSDQDGMTYLLYALTEKGEGWLVDHQGELELRLPQPEQSGPRDPNELPF